MQSLLSQTREVFDRGNCFFINDKYMKINTEDTPNKNLFFYLFSLKADDKTNLIPTLRMIDNLDKQYTNLEAKEEIKAKEKQAKQHGWGGFLK